VEFNDLWATAPKSILAEVGAAPFSRKPTEAGTGSKELPGLTYAFYSWVAFQRGCVVKPEFFT
jgi:hypothetical protein